MDSTAPIQLRLTAAYAVPAVAAARIDTRDSDEGLAGEVARFRGQDVVELSAKTAAQQRIRRTLLAGGVGGGVVFEAAEAIVAKPVESMPMHTTPGAVNAAATRIAHNRGIDFSA